VPGDAMTLDPRAIQSAEQALSRYLHAEAEQQRAYLFKFPDGRISLELEWIDVGSITHAVVSAYVAALNRDGA
jgi:hypothetical protein